MMKWLCATVLFANSCSTLAWDGVVTATIAAIDVTDGSNYGFRVYMTGSPVMCSAGAAWAYLYDTDSNYQTFVAVLLAAKAQKTPVTIFSNIENNLCHIRYITSQ